MQQVGQEYLVRGFEAKAFPWRVVTSVSDGLEMVWGAFCGVGFARQVASQTAIGILDAALLPRAVGIAEICVDADAIPKLVMIGELGSVILGQ